MFEGQNDILTVREIQELLFISRNTAYELLRSGQLHSFKIGNSWRVSRLALEDYIRYKSSSKRGRFSV